MPVTYADISNCAVLVEVARKKGGYMPDLSFGTHFFQDLVESQIYPLAVYPDEPGDHLNLNFIKQSQNQIRKFIAEPTQASECIKVVHVPTERPGHHLEIVMDGQRGLGYLTQTNSKAP